MVTTPPPDGLWADLKPGDGLLYRSKGFWAALIRWKTWAPVSHVEVYMGYGLAYAARDGVGVRSFPARHNDLFAVVRPLQSFNAAAATEWFNANAVGQKYDWFGLLRFYTWGKQSLDKQFCSEVATRLWRAGNVRPFADGYDADLVSPGMVLSSPAFWVFWRADSSKG